MQSRNNVKNAVTIPGSFLTSILRINLRLYTRETANLKIKLFYDLFELYAINLIKITKHKNLLVNELIFH